MLSSTSEKDPMGEEFLSFDNEEERWDRTNSFNPLEWSDDPEILPQAVDKSCSTQCPDESADGRSSRTMINEDSEFSLFDYEDSLGPHIPRFAEEESGLHHLSCWEDGEDGQKQLKANETFTATIPTCLSGETQTRKNAVDLMEGFDFSRSENIRHVFPPYEYGHKTDCNEQTVRDLLDSLSIYSEFSLMSFKVTKLTAISLYD